MMEEGDEQNEEIRKETSTSKGGKRKRTQQHAMFARRCLLAHLNWPYICVFTRKRNRTNVMCARSVFVILML